jgi:hypothetical protein
MIAFISEEYIGINKETEEPVIRTAVKYRWSSKVGGKCTYNNDMNKTLTEEEMAEFSTKHASWGRANAVAQDAANDDMPF